MQVKKQSKDWTLTCAGNKSKEMSENRQTSVAVKRMPAHTEREDKLIRGSVDREREQTIRPTDQRQAKQEVRAERGGKKR